MKMVIAKNVTINIYQHKENRKMLKPISKRESEVFSFIVEGFSNAEISSKMGIAEKTVKFHTTNIFKKTGQTSRSRVIVNYYKTLTKGI